MDCKSLLMFLASTCLAISFGPVRAYADTPSMERANSTIVEFLETLESERSKERFSFDSVTPRTADRGIAAKPSDELHREEAPENTPKNAPSDPSVTRTAAGQHRSMTTITPVRSMTLQAVFLDEKLPESRHRPDNVQTAQRDPYWGTPTVVTKQWAADNLAHKRLYLEDVRLERHGKAHGDFFQAHLSSLRFFGDAIVFPLRYMLTSPDRCFYVQCEGRPGAPRECAPPDCAPQNGAPKNGAPHNRTPGN